MIFMVSAVDGLMAVNNAVFQIDVSSLPPNVSYVVFEDDDGGFEYGSGVNVRVPIKDPTPYLACFDNWLTAAAAGSPNLVLPVGAPVSILSVTQAQQIKNTLLNTIYDYQRQLPLSYGGSVWSATDQDVANLASALAGILATAPPSAPVAPQTVYFTSSQTVTIPTGVTSALVRLVGGGGGASAAGSGVGAGGGGYLEKLLTGLVAGNTLILIIGAGGNSSPASNGGATTLASGTQTISTLTAGGGHLGSAGSNGAGGTATGGDLNIPGGPGAIGAGGSTPLGSGGNDAAGNLYGGGASVATTGQHAGAAGAAVFQWYNTAFLTPSGPLTANQINSSGVVSSVSISIAQAQGIIAGVAARNGFLVANLGTLQAALAAATTVAGVVAVYIGDGWPSISPPSASFALSPQTPIKAPYQ